MRDPRPVSVTLAIRASICGSAASTTSPTTCRLRADYRVERVLRRVPLLVVEIDDVHRRHACGEERQMVVLDPGRIGNEVVVEILVPRRRPDRVGQPRTWNWCRGGCPDRDRRSCRSAASPSARSTSRRVWRDRRSDGCRRCCRCHAIPACAPPRRRETAARWSADCGGSSGRARARAGTPRSIRHRWRRRSGTHDRAWCRSDRQRRCGPCGRRGWWRPGSPSSPCRSASGLPRSARSWRRPSADSWSLM